MLGTRKSTAVHVWSFKATVICLQESLAVNLVLLQTNKNILDIYLIPFKKAYVSIPKPLTT